MTLRDMYEVYLACPVSKCIIMGRSCSILVIVASIPSSSGHPDPKVRLLVLSIEPLELVNDDTLDQPLS
jgi:hypothetical protein